MYKKYNKMFVKIICQMCPWCINFTFLDQYLNISQTISGNIINTWKIPILWTGVEKHQISIKYGSLAHFKGCLNSDVTFKSCFSLWTGPIHGGQTKSAKKNQTMRKKSYQTFSYVYKDLKNDSTYLLTFFLLEAFHFQTITDLPTPLM